MSTTAKTTKRLRRHRRIRAKISGTAERPRLSFFRSNRFLYGQVINDEKGATLASISSKTITAPSVRERAFAAGRAIALAASKKKIKKVVFDRGGFSYEGVVKAFADGARDGGLAF